MKYLKDMGTYYFYPVTGGYGKSGVPDIVGCYQGMFFGLECKAGKNKPTPLQEKNLKDIRDAGGVALVINEENVDDVVRLIQDYITYNTQTRELVSDSAASSLNLRRKNDK
jgi:Holliday junction resolvase